MIDISLNKALATEESGNTCKDCILIDENCSNFVCKSTDRKDGKNVIFKLIDLPKENIR